MTTTDRMKNQVVVRMDQPTYEALQLDAHAHGRTVSQSIRFYLQLAMNTRSAP